jgi:biotin/methionine sulfoxide reductase
VSDLRPTTSHWGAFAVRVDDDAIVDIVAHPADPCPSPLLGNVAGALRHHSRVTRPAIRRGWLTDGPGPSGRRGSDEFVDVGWDEVLELLAAELARVRHDHGNEAIFGGSYGWASAGRFHQAQGQLHRFLNQLGGFTGSRNSYSLGTSLVLLPHVVGDANAVLRRASSWPTIIANTELLVAFGGLPAKNVFVTPGGVTRHATPGFLDQLSSKGAEVALISPLRSDLPPSVTARWYPVAPGTDVALMLGLAHTLVADGLADRAFLDRYTVGHADFESYLTGTTDGVAKDADWAAAICGLPAADIRSLAHRMAASRTLITVTWSLQRIDHGEQPVWAALVLACMLGQIGLPGGGFGHGYGSMGDVGDTGPLLALPTLPVGHNPVATFIPVARISDLLLHPGEIFDYDGDIHVYPDIRLVYWAGGNPFHHHQDLHRLRRAFGRPDTIVVHEPYWTATARHADIVLPVTTALERDDLGSGRRDTHLIAMHRAIDPVGEARDDYDIFASLAERLSVTDAFTEGRTSWEWLAHLYEAWRASMARRDVVVPEFDRFWADGGFELPAGEPEHTLMADFRSDPEKHPLKTPSGRIEITSATIAAFGYDDCPGHPTWIEPREWPGSPLARRYPLHLIANQPSTRLHSQLDMGGYSAAGKVAGREAICMHPDDAGDRGIAAGDVVRVFNDLGSCLAGAVLSDGIRPGVVQLPTGAWYDPFDHPEFGAMCAHGNPNVLTTDLGASRLSQGCSGQHALVEIARYDGTPPPVRAHDPPHLVDRDSIKSVAAAKQSTDR